MVEFLSSYLEHFTTLGLFLALVLAGLGVPIPEDIILITGGVLAHQRVIHLGWTIPILYVGVLSGDLILYSCGRRFGDTVLRHPRVRRLLSSARQQRIGRYFARYGNRTVFLVRHLAVLRAPTYLIAGAMKVPGWQFLLWDGLAALLSVPLMVSLGYFFADHIEVLHHDLRRIEHWVGALVILTVITYLLVRYRDTWWTPRQDAISSAPQEQTRKKAINDRGEEG
ncbi:MAG: DedA family protein [Deltaproteobacteria bacterium]|nr:DedA family protein [Deltaproteobacteria bacterium]